MTDEPKSSNGTGALAKFLNGLNPTTLIAILLMGGGNLFTTKQGNDEIEKAIRQVKDLHEALEETDKRQRTAMDNQRQLLENDSKLLKQVHDIAARLDRLKSLDQMRGAPD